MSKTKVIANLSEKVKLEFPKGHTQVFMVEAYTEDEYVLSGKETKFSSLDKFPSKEVIIASTAMFDGKRVTKGDKVKLMNKEGKSIDMYVSYILNKDSLIISRKKDSTLSVLNWFFKLMSTF